MKIRAVAGLLLAVLLVCASACVSAGGLARTAAAPHGGGWDEKTFQAILRHVAARQPTFPARECNILAPQYSKLVRKVTDGVGSPVQRSVWYYGDAINTAIADCHDSGGGTVVIPADGSLDGGGTYYSGAITLLSNVNLHIATGATVRFVRNPSNEYYPVVLTSYAGTDFYGYSPLVYALNQTNIALTGGGTLDGQYNVSAWGFPSSAATAGTWGVLTEMDDAGVPVDRRIFTADGTLPSRIPVLEGCQPQRQDWGPCAGVRYTAPAAGTEAYRSELLPQFVEFNHSSNILVQGIKLVNTQFWEVHPLNSENITIKGVTIYDAAHGTDDGVDPESCRDVVISGSRITTLDDGIAIKSGRNRDGRELRAPSEDIIVSGDTFIKPGHGGSNAIAVGSEMSGGVYDVFAQDDVAGGSGLGELLDLKTNAYRGGSIRNVYVRNSTVTQTRYGLVRFESGYGEVNPQPHGDVFDPSIRGVYLDNVNTRSSASTAYPPFALSTTVSRSPVEDVSYANSTFYTTGPPGQDLVGPGSAFFGNLRIQRVIIVNPATHVRRVYDSEPLGLTADAVAQTANGAVRLRPDNGCEGCTLNRLPGGSFTLSGKIAGYRRLKPKVEVYVDRTANPIALRVSGDGSFGTAAITLNNGEYWFRGKHYVSIKLQDGINVNTIVYQSSK
jgi:polygalacturonase